MENRQTDSDQLAAVGVALKAARRAAGFSLDDVSARLCISVRYLKAIEGGNRAQIPGTTYMLGFVRSYAKLLKLDADALCGRIIDSMPMDALKPEYQAIGSAMEVQHYPMRYIIGAVAGLVLLYGGWYLSRHYFVSSSNTLPDEVSVSPDTPEAILPESEVVDDAEPAPVAPVAPVLVLKATVDTWVEIATAAGDIVVARLLIKDEVLAVMPDAVLTTGNAGGLLIGYEGDEASWQALGGDGEILQTKTIDSLFLPQ